MTDPKLAWYRHRAEEEGAAAVYWFRLCEQRIAARGSYFYPGSENDAADVASRRAREAAHYANLALGPDLTGWGDNSMTDSPIPSPASVLADLEALDQQYRREVADAGRASPLTQVGFALQVLALLPRLQALFAQQETEKAQLQEIIAKANNTVLGSYGFFLEPSFVEAIDNIKAASNRHYNEKLAADARAIALERELKELDVLADQWAVAHGGYVGNAKGVLLSLPDLDARATHAEAQLASSRLHLETLLDIVADIESLGFQGLTASAQADVSEARIFLAAEAERDALRTQLERLVDYGVLLPKQP